ncbi:MAG: 4Fe-4S dicluster domain-containing protein [Lancefieldella rimae]
MVIDLKRCSGCKTCSVVCKIANNIPNNIIWNRVLTEGGNEPDTCSGTFPDANIQHWPIACQHCENPACVKVCPVGATWKDSETGIVHQDPSKCIGCRMCVASCPYTGVRSFNWEEPQYYAEVALGDTGAMVHQKHTVEKCIFCEQRVAEGKDPACGNSAWAAHAYSAISTTRIPKSRCLSPHASTPSCILSSAPTRACTTSSSGKEHHE